MGRSASEPSPEAQAAAQLLASYFWTDPDDEAAQALLEAAHARQPIDWYAVARSYAAVLAVRVTDEEERSRLIRLLGDSGHA